VAASKETIMNKCQTAIAVFPNRDGAEKAVKTLTAAGFEMKNLTVVGKGYHSEEKGTHTRGAAELPRAREDFGV
jgi:hypothetical protein